MTGSSKHRGKGVRGREGGKCGVKKGSREMIKGGIKLKGRRLSDRASINRISRLHLLAFTT